MDANVATCCGRDGAFFFFFVPHILLSLQKPSCLHYPQCNTAPVMIYVLKQAEKSLKPGKDDTISIKGHRSCGSMSFWIFSAVFLHIFESSQLTCFWIQILWERKQNLNPSDVRRTLFMQSVLFPLAPRSHTIGTPAASDSGRNGR